MFESIVASILDKHLGSYVSNFDPKNLKIGLLSGEVRLQNLNVIGSAFDQFDLPISVLRGTIGDLFIKIPVGKLHSKSVVVEVSDIHLLLRPKKSCKWSPEEEKQKSVILKEQKLDLYDTFKGEQKPNEKEKESGDAGFIKKLTDTIVNNLQVKVKDVHIRYEDLSDEKNPIVGGMTLQDVIIGSCDENFIKTFIVEVESGMVHKILEILKFSVYFENECPKKKLLSTRLDITQNDFKSEMRNFIKSNQKNFVLFPMSPVLKLTMQQGKLNLKEPKIKVDLIFNQIDIHLDDKQYSNFLVVLEYMINFQKLEKYRLIKPMKKINKENAKEYLDYIIKTSHLTTMEKYFSWKDVLQRRKDRKKYIELYKRKKEVPWLPKLEDKEKEELKEIKSRLSYEDIILFRGLAQGEIDIETKKNQEYLDYLSKKEKQKKKWFSWNQLQDEEPAIVQLSEDQKLGLYKDIGYSKTEEIETLKLPEDYIKVAVSARINQGTLYLDDNQTQLKILQADLSKLNVQFDLRETGAQFEVNLNDFDVNDCYNHSSLYSRIVSRRSIKTSSSGGDLGRIFVDYKPVSKKSDIQIEVDVKQTDLVFNHEFIQRIIAFFVIPSALDFREVNKISFLRKHAENQLKMALKEKLIIDMKFTVAAPRILVPQNCESEESPVFLIDLGKLNIKSNMDIQEKEERLKKKELTNDDVYDLYNINLSEIHGLMTNFDDVMNDKISMDNLILKDLNLSLNFFNSIIPENLSYSRFKLKTKISPIQFYLSPKKIESMVRVLNNVLILAENPRGVKFTDLIVASKLKVLTPKDLEPTEYWVELRDKIGILIFQSEKSKNPIKKINIFNKNVSLKDVHSKAFQILLPQQDKRVFEIVLESEDTKTSEKWMKSIKEMIIDYSNSLVLSGRDTDVLQDEPKDENEDSLQQTLFESEFLLEEFSIFVEESQKTILSTSLNNLFVEVNVRKYDVSVSAKLNSFYIKYQDTTDIISYKDVKEHDSLLSFSLVHVMSHKSDIFDKEAETKVKVHLSGLSIVFEPEILTEFIKFGFRMIDILKLIKPKQDNFKVTEKAITKPNNNFKLTTSFDSVSVGFEEQKKLFASGSVTSGEVNVVVRSNELEVSGKLGDLVLLDFDENTIHKEIIGLKEKQDSLIEFKYHQLVSSTHIEVPEYTKSLSLNIRCIKVIYIQTFISKCLEYVTTVQVLPILKEYAEKEQREKKISQKKSNVNMNLVGLDIQIHSPLFMIPVSHKSVDHIAGSLGLVKIKNSIDHKENHVISDSLSIKVNDINMNTNIADNLTPIIRDTNVNVKIDRVVINPNHLSHEIEIAVDVSKIETVLSRNQYQFIFKILNENIFDKRAVNSIRKSNPIHQIDIKTKKTASVISDVQKKLLLNVNMKYMDFTLADENDSHITQFIVQKLGFELATKSDNSLNGNFSLHDITVVDQRKDAESAFSEIISTVNISNKTNQLYMVSFDKEKDSKFALSLHLSPLRFMFIPDYILSVKKFIDPEKLTEDVAKLTQLFDKKEQKNVLPSSKEKKSNMQLDIKADFTKVLVAFPENNKDKNSRLIIAEAGAKINLSKSSDIVGSFKVIDIAIYPQSSIISKDEKVEYILHPYPIDINFHSKEKMKKFSVNIGIEQIKTSLSYQDVKSAVLIMKPLKGFIEELQNSQKTITQEIKNIENTPKLEKSEKEISLDLTLKMKTNSLYIVDDFTGIDFPLFHIDVKETVLNMQLTKQKNLTLESSVSSILQAYYYNQSYSEWEPCLETFHFDAQFKIKENPESKSTPMTYSILIGDETKKFPLSINITQTMLETTKKTITIWKEGIESDYKIRTKFYPYLIKNQCGKPLYFTKENDETNKIHMNDREEIPLEFDNISSKNKLSVHIDGIGKKLIDIAKVQQYYFTDGKKLNIFIDIELKDGIKVITIRAGLRIFNNSTIEWTIKDTVNYSGGTFGSVKPGEYLGLPYHAFSEGTLCVQPTEQKDSYDWSTYGDSLKYDKLIRSTLEFQYVECASTNVRETTLAYFAIIKTYPKSTETSSIEKLSVYELEKLDYVVEISCPFSFENLLECPLDYEFYDKTTWKSKELKIADGTLKRGERIHFYNFDLKNIILLKCKPSGDWTFDGEYSLVYASSKKNNKPMTSSFLVSNEKNKQSAELRYDYVSNTENALKEIIVFVSHWMINRTGMELTLYDNDDNVIKLNDENSITFYSGGPKQKFSAALSDKKSSIFSLETIGADGSFTLEKDSKFYDICHSIHLAPGRFSRTKIVTFSPKIVLFNKIKETVQLKQFGTDNTFPLDQEKYLKFYFEKNEKDQMLTIKVNDYQFSKPFKINSDGESIIKILPEEDKLEIIYLSIETQLNNGYLLVIFSKMDKAPYTFENETSNEIEFHQIGEEKTNWKIEEKSGFTYSWDNNYLTHKIEIKIKSTKFELDLNRIMKPTEFKIENDEKIYISMEIQGLTKLIRISEKLQTNKSFRKAKDEIELIQFQYVSPAVGISLINDKPSEIAFIYLEKLYLSYSQTKTKRYVELKMGRLEINDQTKYCLFPVIFSSSNKKKEKEFIHFSVCQSLEESSIFEFPYFSFAMQEAMIQVDYVFIKTFSSYIQTLIKKDEKEQNVEVEKQLNDIVKVSEKPKNEKKFYFNTFELHPIKSTISFQFNKPRGETISYNPIMTVLNSLGQTIGGIDEVGLCLKSLILINPLETKNSLINKIKTHYQRCVTMEFYKIIGGLDMIGNPIGLFSDVNTGISDFFYEPAQAIFLVQSPQEVASGIGRGTQSLIYGTLHGTFGSASKVTKSVQKGLNFLTFDEEFIKEKEERSKKKSFGLQAGLEDGSKEMLEGFSEGLGGLFWQPVTGAQQEGFGGFIKGVGKGLIGAPVKSVSGVVNFFSKTTEGISNTGRTDITRVRYPRTFRKDGLLVPYSFVESQIRFALDNYFDKKFKNEQLIAHLKLKGKTMAVLTKRILFIFGEGFSVENEIILKTIEKIEFKNEIKITIPKTGLFSLASTQILDSPNKQELKYFYQDLKNLTQ